MSFNSLIVRKDDEGKTSAAVENITIDRLPEGNVTVAVEYSTVAEVLPSSSLRTISELNDIRFSR